MRDPEPPSLAEFLAWEARQPIAHEMIDGLIVAMSNPTIAHGRLVRRLSRAIDAAVGDDCDVFAGDMTVRIENVARDSAPRPDVVVTCDERDVAQDGSRENTIRYPKLVVEVLSPATAARDLGSKLRGYFSLPSLEEYLIVDSRTRFVILHRRVDGTIRTTLPESVVELSSIGCSISLDELYANVSLSSET